MGVNAKDKTKGVLSFSSGTPKYDRETERRTARARQRHTDRDIQTERDTHRGRERECVCLNTLGHGGGGKIMEG